DNRGQALVCLLGYSIGAKVWRAQKHLVYCPHRWSPDVIEPDMCMRTDKDSGRMMSLELIITRNHFSDMKTPGVIQKSRKGVTIFERFPWTPISKEIVHCDIDDFDLGIGWGPGEALHTVLLPRIGHSYLEVEVSEELSILLDEGRNFAGSIMRNFT